MDVMLELHTFCEFCKFANFLNLLLTFSTLESLDDVLVELRVSGVARSVGNAVVILHHACLSYESSEIYLGRTLPVRSPPASDENVVVPYPYLR